MEFLISLFPATILGWAVQLIISIAVTYVMYSIGEYIAHRFFMHQGVPNAVYTYLPGLKQFLYEHRVLHHQKYYKQFDHEPDEHGRDINLVIGTTQIIVAIFLFVPYFILTTMYISIIPTIVLILAAVLHTVTWNTIHTEMHQPKYPFWSRWNIYKYLARHHYLHHQNTHNNFNVVVPGVDLVLGTLAYSTKKDEEEIERLRYSAK